MIKIPIPSKLQEKNYTCGPACLHAVATYFGVGLSSEDEYIKPLKATPQEGTIPRNIVIFARKLGLQVKLERNMDILDLIKLISKNIPVICAVQAHGDQKYYGENWSGHYVVAIGYNDKEIFFQDPFLEGYRAKLSYAEFVARWHDQDGNSKPYKRLGIAVWKKTKPKEIGKMKKVKKMP